MTEAEIAKGMGMTRNEMTDRRSIAIAQQKQDKILMAQRLRERGWSHEKIGERMGGLNESSVRALLAPGEMEKAQILHTTANMIEEQVNKKGMIQVGSGVEHQLGITRTRLNTAITILKDKGYTAHTIYIPQIGSSDQYTMMKVLAKPGTTLSEVNRNRDQIQLITNHSEDHGRSYLVTQPPISINSRRIRVNYKEDGGDKADGMIYVRPGVDDIRIGANRYGQVRVAVDGTHYLKGMAIYKSDLPPGVDIVYNTKNSNTGRKKDAMKEMEVDENGNINPDNPFGAIVRQVHDEHGKVNSAMNMVGSPNKPGSGEEGQWDTYSRNLSSQVLSKQSPDLIKKQLNLTYDRRIKEFNEINSLTNPIVRKELLVSFADATDSAAVHLQAASLPRQATKVLIPIPSMKPNEVYIPSMRDGERVAIVRFPHAGTFEIPQLTVNNRNREARKLLGTGEGTQKHDAIGIHHRVAEHLSGADFDGDFVTVIPNNKGLIKSTPALEKLKGFDPNVYKIPKGSPVQVISSTRKQHEMGKISNLITDMTLQGADTEKLARAVKHSMVVIDSEKHELDFKRSERDNGILSLKEEYQGRKDGGAKTLISRAGSDARINQRRPRSPKKGGPIDPVTGKKVYEDTGRMVPVRKRITDPATGKKITVDTGVMEPKKTKFERLAITDNAHDLSSGTIQETIYADHSNRLKALANEARKESVPIKGTRRSPSAAKVYAHEVSSLTAKLNLAEKNAPLEKQAQLLAQAHIAQVRQAKPHMTAGEVKKAKQLALNEARNRVGAKKDKVIITQSEWDAIQAAAIGSSKVEKILSNTDVDTIKRYAMPKTTPKLTAAMQSRARTMLDNGYTEAEVADHFNIGLTTLKIGING
jgi:hypothetical protein